MRFTYPTITPDEFDTRYEADFGTAIVGDPMAEWQPIRDLPSDWQELQDPSLHYLATL
jgi:hypothetical protein